MCTQEELPGWQGVGGDLVGDAFVGNEAVENAGADCMCRFADVQHHICTHVPIEDVERQVLLLHQVEGHLHHVFDPPASRRRVSQSLKYGAAVLLSCE